VAAIRLRASSTESQPATFCAPLDRSGPVHDLKANEVNDTVRKRTMIRWSKGAIGVAKV
jgi:hypothetical protein